MHSLVSQAYALTQRCQKNTQTRRLNHRLRKTMPIMHAIWTQRGIEVEDSGKHPEKENLK